MTKTMKRDKPDKPIYSKNTLEFLAVAKSYCDVMEQSSALSTDKFVETVRHLLPLLYLKGSLLPEGKSELDEAVELFATETQYAYIASSIADILGEKDAYLEVFHPDMPLSDTPVAAFISESLADIWQDLYNFVETFRMGHEPTMNEALSVCRAGFGPFWGQTIVNVLRALHQVQFDADEPATEDENTYDDL